MNAQRKIQELEITPSPTREEDLAEEIRKKNRERWLEENREAIEAYNDLVAKHGVFSDGLRGF